MHPVLENAPDGRWLFELMKPRLSAGSLHGLELAGAVGDPRHFGLRNQVPESQVAGSAEARRRRVIGRDHGDFDRNEEHLRAQAHAGRTDHLDVAVRRVMPELHVERRVADAETAADEIDEWICAEAPE